MSLSSAHVTEAVAAAAEKSPEWRAAGATVRLVLTDLDTEVTLDAEGRPTTEEPAQVLRVSWSDLRDLTAGRRSFLRTVTSKRLSARGPVMQTFAVGQALATLSLDH
ncbi:hypothetical protein [Streptomyces sp. WM6386]|uniref:hypothetical protein n=1 Tax=Streptomyces sp. WM6386 TaxID=1415558 RepID=UPI0006197047|nr:hypothetical protein [Streptomyces sp. WM6386]KKD03474.1 hypothetical protein TN53_34915 [Streptomyces sp. WM6386]